MTYICYLTAFWCGNESSWTVNIAVNSELITFKVGTGAKVTAITEFALAQLGKITVTPSNKISDRKPLKVLGQTCVTLSCNGKSCKHDVFVMKKLKHNLLDLPAIKELITGPDIVNWPSHYRIFTNNFQIC